ncbi:centrosomal protein of 162 kDa-like [Physella acuta]|uniref:centrosomal protein of 162 kDa-like n=1 Tax=Physella acuta TaxID=109671 RepID=UPI0027DC7E57|nr:centrosomal protein of 162 kDa-like [Physella acuta]
MAKSKRWSKEELDSTFEEFLKISVSSGDDTEKINQLLKNPAKKADSSSSSLWWANDLDEDDSYVKEKSKSFIKTKKSLESPVRSKSSTNKIETKQNVKGKNTAVKPANASKQVVINKKFTKKDEQKLKSQTSSAKTRTTKSKNDVAMSKDSLEDISERTEEIDSHRQGKGKPVSPVKISVNDSSLDTSGTASYDHDHAKSNLSKDNLGFDTLDELADKQHFFQNLEKDVDGTVDYGRLNQELSQTGGTSLLSPAVQSGATSLPSPAMQTGATSLPSPAVNLGNTPADTSVLSEDTETPAKVAVADTPETPQQKPSMLSRVALLDSLESTFNTATSPQLATSDHLGQTLPDSFKYPGLSGQIGTNTSREMEALQRVLQEAEMSPTLYGIDSRPSTAKAANMSSTPLNEERPVARSVGDILKEMDAIERRGIDMGEADVQLRSDYKSPRSQAALHRKPSYDADSFDNSHTEDTEIYRPVTSASVKDRKRLEKKNNKKEARTVSVPENIDKIAPARDRFSHIQSSGYGRSTSPPASRKHRSASAGKSPPKGQRSSQADGAAVLTKKAETSPGVFKKKAVDKGLDSARYSVNSMEVFAKYLTEHFASAAQVNDSGDQRKKEELPAKSGHERETALMLALKETNEELSAEKIINAQLKADILAQEKDFQKKLESQKMRFEDEIFAVKQDNFVLTAKLKEMEDIRLKKSDTETEAGDPAESRVSKLEREVQEQENLLAGYQAENKRLYEEVKAVQRQAKATESSMFKENQRLTTELSNVRQELELKNTELQNKGIITSMAVQQQIAAGNTEAMIGATRIAHLEGELTEAKRVQENLGKELKMAQQNRFELERHLEAMLKEKESLARQLADSLTADQAKAIEVKHREDLDKLEKKIKWYAENQELLDKSSAKLRLKDDEIHRLKMRLEDFKSEAGRKLEENKLRAKEKAADAKRIQDLERQVKEMEQVIRRRHPNSLPAMMMVAANVPDSALDQPQVKGRSVEVLENRVRKLERELETKDEMAQQDLRAMEQKYNQVKFQFEERISDLEQQLSLYCRSSGEGPTFRDHPHSHAVALERELDNVKDRCRKQVAEMQAETDRLTAELNKVKKNQENMMRNDARQSEVEWKQQILALQRELKDREHDVQILQQALDRMRAKSGKKNGSQKVNTETELSFPTHSNNKEYKPDVFADSDKSALIQENQVLRSKIDQLQLELDQQRVDLRRSLAETESGARQTRERLENQIEALRSSHEKEMQRVLSEQALQSSTSRVTELQSKCDTQEVMIRHLQAQLHKTSLEVERIPKLKASEAQLMAQVELLEEKLRAAKLGQAPEMRHFESLEQKLTELVQRQHKREAELEAVMQQNQKLCRAEVEEEVEKWKHLVDSKNQQLQVFRAELDSILEVLKALQRQGVKLPAGTFYS